LIKKISIIGGDVRTIKLIEMLEKDKYEISTYGLEKNFTIPMNKCNTLQECVEGADIIIGPIPFSNEEDITTPFGNKKIKIQEFIEAAKGKIVVAGAIRQDIFEQAKEKQIEMIDIAKREEFAVLNAISTAEGAIQIAIKETSKNLHGNNILILGFGRVGKVLAKMLQGIGAKVACEARKNTDIAWIKAYGYEPIELVDLKENLHKYDIIINTIPYVVLEKEELQKVKKDALIIDLASNPGGVNREEVKEAGIKFVWALSLPGKVSPVTSAEFMKQTLDNIFKETK
jgi:dipicolinate synthase subunit A